MSSPWKFAGTWLPFVESLVSPADVGSGTLYPLAWNRTDGAVSDDQICQFEWTTKTIAMTFEGTVTLSFTNPDPTIIPPEKEDVVCTFSLADSTTPVSGTNWSVLEPAEGTVSVDLQVGGREFASLTASGAATGTASWGAVSASAIAIVSVGNQDGPLLGTNPTNAVSGTDFSDYVKSMFILLTFDSGTDSAALGSFASGTPVNSADVFHGTVDLYGDTRISLSTALVEVTDKFTAPADI